MIDFLKDFFSYIGERKKYWLVPFVIILFFFGALLMLGQNAAIAPFIYTLF